MAERKKLAIIDGKSVFYRGYYAMPNLSTKEGVPTGGVYGFAAMALEHRDAILDRNRRITRENLALLDAWVAGEPSISYVKPKSGTTALLKFAFDMSSRDFCIGLLKSKGVMFTPGSVMNMEGQVRIGYANNADVIKTGLQKTSEYLAGLGA